MNLSKNYLIAQNRDISNNNIFIYISTLLLSTLLIFLFSNLASANNSEEDVQELNIETIYHVYYGEERIGIVDDKNVISEYKDGILESLNEEFEDLDFALSDTISLIPERVFFHSTDNSSTVQELDEVVVINAKSYKVSIGEHVVGHVSRDEDLEQIENLLILEYVSEEELEEFQKRAEDEDIKVGKSRIIDISLSEEIEWSKSSTHPDKILTLDEIIKIAQQGTLEEELYTVKQGDVLGTIASAHDLSMSDIQAINPGITQDSLLQIGDELNVTVLKPMISVIVEKESIREETISYETETRDDNNVWSGTTNVAQEGRDGKKVVEYSVIYENGRAVKQETISEEIVNEPVNRVVIRGTKTSPSRGTGQLAWPAVGGYISSYQGMRWGRYHRGIDIAGPRNHNILAADNGTVSSAGWENGYGNTIRINHNNGMQTMYAHLASINVRVGQTVGKGQTIGRMGSTGNSTGIHLHFEVYQNGQLRNPMDYLNR
ncbi:M23 family metallopeptidase [Evansella sp. AB-P1]|uniref:peptidoglycan DD-metalloendopeptidase family protein n=1 Tax=Evansella sp. AB-P1 TaxID=3037653 RepID=UPI00241E95D8|nr:M23 family metallopeptidase [Evansella sp. AB-P1]MDG5789428.1 M23 family metallopeptidase [Evansella sp. AB-P1]